MDTSVALHNILLLADSALPLGSFAFSSGLESFLAHTKQSRQRNGTTPLSLFDAFLVQSIQNLTSTALPYVLEAYNDPARLRELDNDFDASTPCTVARRASITQGRALITIWEKAIAPSVSGHGAESPIPEVNNQLTQFTTAMKNKQPAVATLVDYTTTLNGHFPPLFGAVCLAMDIPISQAAYIFTLNHAKALLSAAVRASVMGPYQAQMVLASSNLQETIRDCIARESSKTAKEACVTIPPMDLWMGRHELLYSRIFNS